MTTNTRLIAAVGKHNAKPRTSPPPEPLPAGEVAEMVCAYRRGESLTALARCYHRDLTRVRRALEGAGVTLRTRQQQRARNMAERQDATRCRACGIILVRAGCRSYEGACADCWREALKRARAWHCGIREAMERWIEEGRRVESGEAELGEWCGNIKRRAA